MTQLDVLLDFMTQFVAVLPWHRHVAEYEVRLLGPHLLEGGVGVETGDETVVLREEYPHVVDDLRIVVHHKNGRTVVLVVTHIGRRQRVQHKCTGLLLSFFPDTCLLIQRPAFLLCVGLFRHGVDEREHGACALLTVAGRQTAVMQFCQTARVVEADTRTPVHDGLSLVVELVVALEDVLLLFLGDALARIGDGHLHHLIGDVQTHVDMSALGRELQGVG